MSTQLFHCPQCQAHNDISSRFCNKCGTAFNNPVFAQRVQAPQNVLPPKKVNNKLGFAILIGVLILCGLCGLIGAISDKEKKDIAANVTAQPEKANSPASVPSATPTPPPTFAQLKEKSQNLLKLPDRAEYTTEEVKSFDVVKSQVNEIPKDSKDYREARLIYDQLNKKQARLLAEIIVLGAKPENSAYDGNVTPAQNYLRQALNDYGSSEYLGWTKVQKTYIGSEPYWTTTVRIRAKNAFGAFVVNEYTFYIRQNQVVKVDK